jgi:signal transduction histidine kinase
MRLPTVRNDTLRLFSLFVVLVLLSFGSISAYIGHRAHGIDRAALDISENAAPSIIHLAAAHNDLKELALTAERDLELAGRGSFQPTQDLGDLRDHIHRQVELHAHTPEFAGEHLAQAKLDEALAALDQALAHFIAAYTARDLPRAEQIVRSELRQANRQTSACIIKTIAINAENASRGAQQIRTLRGGIARSSLALTVLSVLWVLGLVALLMHAVRRVAVREAQHRMASERAAELELFAGRVAHDILNPVSVLTLLFRAVESGPTGEQLKTIVARGRATLQRMQQILDGLLKFASAAARPEPGASVDVGQVLGELTAELRVQAEAARIELCVEPVPACRIACSQGILYSLITNVAANAIKYMGDASVRRITIRVLDRGALVRFEVQDSGPGLSIELQKVVFRPHVRGKNGTKTTAGFGLGLATVQKAADAHGGRVGVQSEEGHGALFWFELPRC